MRIEKVGHASIIVSAGNVRCFMDPVFEDPFESSANTFDPPIAIDVPRLIQGCNLIVISHAHMDHFSPRTLHAFDRSTPVIYPEHESLIERALERLGFENATAVAPGVSIDVGAMVLVPTDSKASFPEMGMVFKADERVFWNLVDTVVDDKIISATRAVIGRPDLLFAKFQPLIENELHCNALGSGFPLERYGVLLRSVRSINPRYVAPGSCGYRYARADWLNHRGFPITEKQFEADVLKIAPASRVVHVPHGGAVTLADELEVEIDGTPAVKRLGDRVFSAFDWRPERGVPPLSDPNPRRHALDTLRDAIARYLDHELLAALAADRVWSERMARLGVIWRLELVFPDGTIETRHLDLGVEPLAWTPPSPDAFVKLHTSVTASGVYGLMKGECNTYSVCFNDLRIASRLYEAHPHGVVEAGTLDDEPLTKILFEGAEERYLEAELDAILAGGRAGR